MNRTVKSLSFLAVAMSLLVFSCKDDDGPVNPNEIVSDYYYQIVVDGDTVTYQEDVNNYGQIVGDFWRSAVANGYQYAPFTCLASAEAVANPGPATLASSGAVAFMNVTTDQRATYAQYSTLPSTGTKDIGILARAATDSATSGGYVSWFDATGTEWTTNGGVQTNPSFIVTEYVDFEDNERAPATHKIIAANFTCTVYDGNGNSKEITGGRVRGRLIVW